MYFLNDLVIYFPTSFFIQLFSPQTKFSLQTYTGLQIDIKNETFARTRSDCPEKCTFI